MNQRVNRRTGGTGAARLSQRNARGASRPSAPFERLEPRQLFALLEVGVTPPAFFYLEEPGVLTYDSDAGPVAGVGTLDITADTVIFTPDADPNSDDANLIFGPGQGFTLHALINHADGSLYAFGAGSYLTITGGIDLNGNNMIDGNEPSGTLLSGELSEFGFRDTSPDVDHFDFLLKPYAGSAGGELGGLFGTPVAGTLTSENSTFENSFTSDFSGAAKGEVGVSILALGDYVWMDMDEDGIQDVGEEGVNGVTVNLLGSGMNLLATTTTAHNPITGNDGYYIFANLNPGSYIVQFVAPDGNDFTLALQGGDTTTDSNADPLTGLAPVTLTGLVASDMTIDAGLIEEAMEEEQPVTLGDFVWEDCNGNGIQDGDEHPIANVTVQLLDATGAPIAGKTTTTNGSGFYQFMDLDPGTYAVQFILPSGYFFTPANQGSDDAIDSDANVSTGKTPAVTLTSGQSDFTLDAGMYRPARVSGFVYSDLDDDGIKESGEPGIGGVTLTLTGTTGTGQSVTQTTTTSSSGAYSFINLQPGTYTITETQPSGYVDGQDTPGTINSITVGSAPDPDNDTITGITLECADAGINYNFGELGIFHGLTATIGFWHNKNGQELINSFGKTSNGLTLANWLATSLPNLFGKNAPALSTSSVKGANLTGKTNAQVAAYFIQLKNVSGQKAYAQVLATAFAVFTTTNSLNTGATSRALATKHGFVLTNTGAGASTYKVPSASWPAFGITSSSGATKTIAQLLVIANSKTTSGTLNGGNTTLITQTSNVFDAINNNGDIGFGMALISEGAADESDGSEELPGELLFGGTYLVSIDLSTALNAADQRARFTDAITVLNSNLAVFGVILAEMPAGMEGTADIHIRFADTTVIGGVAERVLGLAEAGGAITIVNGWNYYLGSSASGIGGTQYDLQTVFMHELGHAIGLGHSPDKTSAMYTTLLSGQVRRKVTFSDLAIEDPDVGTAPDAYMAKARRKGSPSGADQPTFANTAVSFRSKVAQGWSQKKDDSLAKSVVS